MRRRSETKIYLACFGASAFAHALVVATLHFASISHFASADTRVEYREGRSRIQVPRTARPEAHRATGLAKTGANASSAVIGVSSEATAVASASANAGTPAETSGEPGVTETVTGAALGVRVSYPRLSRTLGEQGRVILELRDETGARLFPGDSPRLISSSGFARLDEAASAALRDAVARGRLPEMLHGRARLEVVFRFRLTDDAGSSQGDE